MTIKKIALVSALFTFFSSQATVWTVNTLTDNTSGTGNAGSLRYCMTNMATGDSVTFGVTGTITLSNSLGALPTISGLTQNNITISTGSSTPSVFIDGSQLTGTNISGFTIAASGCTIQGLAIGGFNQDSTMSGIDIIGANTTIQQCYIGTDGTSAQANQVGIVVSANNILINQCVCSGNVIGIHISNPIPSSIVFSIQNSFIGTNPSGTAALANTNAGIFVQGVVSGFITGNVISGNASYGIDLFDGSNTADLTIFGNYIGTNAAGTAAIPNSAGGISISSWTATAPITLNNNFISGNGFDGISIQDVGNIEIIDNVIGLSSSDTALANSQHGIDLKATTAAISDITISNNTISGNAYLGINMSGFNSFSFSNITIESNSIGTNLTDMTAIGNGLHGIGIYQPASNVSITNNSISGNGGDGIVLSGSISASTIEQNFIGGMNLGNATSGILITNGCSDITIGNSNQSLTNTIAFNGQFGIWLINSGTPDSGISMLTNSIYANSARAIRLEAGENNNQQPPTLTSAVLESPTVITIEGTAPAASSLFVRLDFYATSSTYQSTNPQGQVYLGTSSATPSAPFSETLGSPISLDSSYFITAVATDTTLNNSSAFSNALQASTLTIPVTLTANPTTINPGGSSTLTASFSGGTPPYTASWSDGTMVSNIFFSPITHVVSPSKTTSYNVTLTDTNSNTGTSNTVTVTVNTPPVNSTNPFVQRLIEKYHSRVS